MPIHPSVWTKGDYMKKTLKLIMVTVMLVATTSACAGGSGTYGRDTSLPTVKNVSLKAYVGQWYAVTSLPQFFTRRCVAQEAVYTLNSSTEIGVRNICTRKNGKRTDIKGFAKATNVSGVLALKFTSGLAGFFGASGDYNIIKLDPEYKYALIGGKDRKSLWLLSRTKTISASVYSAYIGRAKDLGFNVSKLVDSKF